MYESFVKLVSRLETGARHDKINAKQVKPLVTRVVARCWKHKLMLSKSSAGKLELKWKLVKMEWVE